MLLGLFSDKLGFFKVSRNPMPFALVEAESVQGTGSCMPSKLGNDPLLINVRK